MYAVHTLTPSDHQGPKPLNVVDLQAPSFLGCLNGREGDRGLPDAWRCGPSAPRCSHLDTLEPHGRGTGSEP